MEKLFSTILILSVVLFTGCASQKPLTENEQAAQYGMTVERYREEKAAAARMGMKFEDHIRMVQDEGSMNMEGMDM
ncbi:hypothetical protein COU76_04655 [Candidatus Peregrinibacteria bacterium CG10_big_fil_rev_8_21_14_0_10_49_10]|nr:MAG: hypothetical protein COU76_04655 [Candidatus Peregrinibacteria bacterium CG10_big_fil_rev_8_21_14_0_10_49_10]